jgi:NHL repeat
MAVRGACMPICALQLLLLVLVPATAWAQVQFTGATSNENLGSQAIGLASAARALNFSILAGTSIGSIAVVTTGIANLDFALGSASTCMVRNYSSSSACTVEITFTPMAAGLRTGAVVFYSGKNNRGTMLASAPLKGVGTGAQIAFGPGTVSAFVARVNGMELEVPNAVAVDAAGDLYILDADTEPDIYRVVKVPANGDPATNISATVNGEGLYLPSCIAVDGAGDLFIGEFYGRIVEVPTGGDAAILIAPTVNGIPLNYPSGLAIDGAGDLYIADSINNRVLELAAGGGAAIALSPTVNGISLNDPHGLAVDTVGDLFIADLGNDRVVIVPAGGGAGTALDPIVNGTGLENPEGLAIDGAGDLFIADNVNHRVVEMPAGDGAPVAIDPGFYDSGAGSISDVAVDSGGDLFIVEGGLEGSHSIIEEVQRAQPPILNFKMLTAVGLTDAIDGTQTVQIVNVGNVALALTAISYPADFFEPAGDLSACAASTILSAGQSCDLPIEFAPQTSGALNESVIITDSALNLTGAQQSIPVSGSSQVEAAIISPSPGTTLPGPTVNFTWSAASGVTWYQLLLGSTGAGSDNLFNSGERTVTSWTVYNLPTNGETIYARMISNFNGVRLSADYTYTAATKAVSRSPKGIIWRGGRLKYSGGLADQGIQVWINAGKHADEIE